jgi:predicted RNA-binding Zn-ribbon protein involved in translation (DUF1610 family)
MREYEEELKNIDAIRNPAQPQEPPVKMTGSINLGNIDFQEQSRRAQEVEAAARKSAEERADRLTAENEKLKTDLLATTINNLQTNLGGQIQKLQADLAAGRGSSKNIGEQLKEIIDSAALLGFVKPEAVKPGPVVQNATDAALSLEMLRIQLEDKRSDRQWAWTMEKDRRQWQLDLRKLDQANRLALAEASAKKEQNAWIAHAPELIGNTIAKGLLSSRAGGVSNNPRPMQRRAPVNQPPPQANNIETEAPASEPGRKIEADIGEAGTIDCSDCGSQIAIGPTATQAICASCGNTVEVVRRGASTPGRIKGGEIPDAA